MFWDVFVSLIFVMGYPVSLTVFLLKRPDRRLASRRDRIVLKLTYLVAALATAWFTVDLIVRLVE